MRDELVGYMLGALDDAETQQVESSISRDARLKEDLRLLKDSIAPLSCDGEHIDPPIGLAQRTCEYVEQHRLTVSHGGRTTKAVLHGVTTGLSEGGAAAAARHWTLLDLAVAAGVLVALGMLVLPAMNHSRFTAQIAACHNKLREIGTALHDYSKNHDGLITEIP
jgi:hypothetical protein